MGIPTRLSHSNPSPDANPNPSGRYCHIHTEYSTHRTDQMGLVAKIYVKEMVMTHQTILEHRVANFGVFFLFWKGKLKNQNGLDDAKSLPMEQKVPYGQ